MACKKLSFQNRNNFDIVYNYVECYSRFIRSNEIIRSGEIKTIISFGQTSDINSFSSAQERFLTFLQDETFPLTPVPTRTPTPTPSVTPTGTQVVTPTPSVTSSPVATSTPTNTPTLTITPSSNEQFLILFQNENTMTAENNNGIQYQH
jgi:hypothetical protein